MRFYNLPLFTVICFGLFASSCAHAVDLAKIEQDLNGEGVVGEVHGASPKQGLYVFTYRNPNDFFDFLEMSLVTGDKSVEQSLAGLHRHDRVRVRGTFLKNPSPQKHIKVAAVEMVKKFESPYATSTYEHEARVPDELIGRESADFLVHAVHADGHILVVEYKDTVLPIWVRNGDLSRDLFRGDVVRLSIGIQKNPGQPTHLKLNESAPKAVEVLESIRAKHGKQGSIEGALVMFPKSPEIKFNVFAVLEELPGGLKRQYTIVNFENAEIFTQLREQLQSAWDRHPTAYVNGRNKLVSTKIQVRASGTFNEINPNQANPQILVPSLEQLELTDR